jgi:UDP-N-acetylglucosamine acyltransferase
VHHFVTVGEYAFVGGLTRVAQDVPPFMLLEGNPSRVWAINRVGLKRRSFSSETMDALKVAHRMLFRSGKPRAQSCQDLLDRFPHIPEIAILCNFLHATELNNYGRARQPLNDDES